MENPVNFKSDLGKIKKGNPKLKAENQKSVIQNVQHFFELREFCYLKLNAKQNMEMVSEY